MQLCGAQRDAVQLGVYAARHLEIINCRSGTRSRLPAEKNLRTRFTVSPAPPLQLPLSMSTQSQTAESAIEQFISVRDLFVSLVSQLEGCWNIRRARQSLVKRFLRELSHSESIGCLPKCSDPHSTAQQQQPVHESDRSVPPAVLQPGSSLSAVRQQRLLASP